MQWKYLPCYTPATQYSPEIGSVTFFCLYSQKSVQMHIYLYPAFFFHYKWHHALHVNLPFAFFYLAVYLGNLSILLYIGLLFFKMVCSVFFIWIYITLYSIYILLKDILGCFLSLWCTYATVHRSGIAR